jgi:signal transduction histidine kinase
MLLLPGHETIPFHLLWIGLCLVYGFTVWQPTEMVVMVAISAVVTGGIMVYHAFQGHIEWAETAEVPLSVVLASVIAVYLRKRHLALTELARIAQEEHRRIAARQILVRQISHELRTPITIARGYTELIRNHAADQVVAEDTGIVLEELDKLAQITERLVTLIQVDGQLNREPVTLSTELTRIVRRWTPTADRNWKVQAAQGSVLANRERLEVALDCLLDNAIRYTKPGDSISVTGTIDSGSWGIEVADSGSGMTSAHADALTQARAVPREELSGTGLGLATVRSIAGSWGGNLLVRSVPGGGTQILLRFPGIQPS